VFYSINAASVISPIALNSPIKKINKAPAITPNQRNWLEAITTEPKLIVPSFMKAARQNNATISGISPMKRKSIDTLSACKILTNFIPPKLLCSTLLFESFKPFFNVSEKNEGSRYLN